MIEKKLNIKLIVLVILLTLLILIPLTIRCQTTLIDTTKTERCTGFHFTEKQVKTIQKIALKEKILSQEYKKVKDENLTLNTELLKAQEDKKFFKLKSRTNWFIGFGIGLISGSIVWTLISH